MKNKYLIVYTPDGIHREYITITENSQGHAIAQVLNANQITKDFIISIQKIS